METVPKFDPSQAVTFDLAFGHVHLDSAPNRVMIPADQLVKLCNAAGEAATVALAVDMGHAMGKRSALRIAQGAADRLSVVRGVPFEQVIEHLAAEFALVGLGTFGAERWGKGLVLVHDQSPLGTAGDMLIARVLEAAIAALSGATAHVVRLEHDGVRARFLVVSGEVAERVRARLGAGEHWGSIVASLHKRA